MPGSGSGGGQVIVVSHLKQVMVLFDLRLVRRFVRRAKGNGGAVRRPSKLLNTQRRMSDLLCFAAVHRQSKDLRHCFLFVPSLCKKRQLIARRRKLWRA